MKRIGTTLVLLGVGSYVLPMFGMQFRLFGSLDPSEQAIAAIGSIVIGAVLLVVGGKKDAAPAAQ